MSEDEQKKGTATARCSYLWHFRCLVCGYRWTMDTGSVHDMTAYEPCEGEEIDCENEECDAVLVVKMTE